MSKSLNEVQAIAGLPPTEQFSLFTDLCDDPNQIYMLDHKALDLDDPCAATITRIDRSEWFVWRCTTADAIVYGCVYGLQNVKDAIVAAQQPQAV